MRKILISDTREKDQDYEDLMRLCKSVFNFHPNDSFTSVGQILHEARKSVGLGRGRPYDQAVSYLAEKMASYIDKVHSRNPDDHPSPHRLTEDEVQALIDDIPTEYCYDDELTDFAHAIMDKMEGK